MKKNVEATKTVKSQKNNKKKSGARKSLPTVLLLLVFVAGLSILMYPTVSNWWNSKHASRVITDYNAAIANATPEDFLKWRTDAQSYNASLVHDGGRYTMTDAERIIYNSLLNIGGTSTIGSIEIPTLSVYLPIYHGTGEAVLASGVGHLEGSSLPVGGEGTHCVLTGHRGLPSARLFTDLDKLALDDLFLLHVLDETLAYKIDQILVVLPGETQALAIDPDKDYCTLITCTPYGVNSHRLLIRGQRVDYEQQANTVLRISPDAMRVDPLLVAPIVAVPILLILLVWLMVSTSKRNKRKNAATNSVVSDIVGDYGIPPDSEEGSNENELP